MASVTHPGPAVVLDPVNRDNNVAHDWNESDRARFVANVQEFCDVLRDAAIEDSVGDSDSAAAFLDQVLPHFSDWSKGD